MNAAPTPHRPIAELGRRLAATAWRRWRLDRSAEFWLGELNRSWSLVERRATVVEVIDETADARTLVLAPGRRWPGHRAGQYVPIDVEIDGVRARRYYSISSGASPPGARQIAITVKRLGRVSSWLHAHAGPGALIALGDPAGDFVLPAATPRRLLFVVGGSGITPIIAMLRELERRAALADVVLVHCAASAGDAIFDRELASLARHAPGLRRIAHHRDERDRLDPAALRALVPDLADRETYVCAPPGLIDVVARAAAGVGAAHRVHRERFTAAAPPACATTALATLTRSGRTVALAGPGSLLAQLERAGERPAHGCRIGICNTCRCRKERGTVEDLVTGAISSEPDQEIRLCVSVARADLVLAL